MFIAYGDSRVGLARKINEDSISDCTGPFFILADGMGRLLITEIKAEENMKNN